MRAKIDLKVEIIDGPDAVYVLEEHNKVLNLDDADGRGYEEIMKPYRVTVAFYTPDYFRRLHGGVEG